MDTEPDHGAVPADTPKDTADYAAASQSTADFIKNIGPIKEARRKRKRRRVVLLVLAVILVLGAVGYGAYRYVNRPASPERSAQDTDQTDRSEETATLENFSSRELGIKLEYPSDWTVDESVSDQVSLISPQTDLPGESDDMSAKVVVTVRANDGTLPGFDDDSALAVRDSIKLAYESPSQIQRAETYLSFVSHSSAETMDAIYITGDFGYRADAIVSKEDILHTDPTVSVRFYACQDDVCDIEESNAIAIRTTVWEDNRALQAALGILKSLHIQ